MIYKNLIKIKKIFEKIARLCFEDYFRGSAPAAVVMFITSIGEDL
jgi:hypothetical protein